MFDVYQLPAEHEAIREAVRDLCAGKVAPYAAQADENSEFPQASYDALRASDFHAPHIPAEYGGGGAGALPPPPVIQEDRPGCAPPSPIPSGHKLGPNPPLLARSPPDQHRHPPPLP